MIDVNWALFGILFLIAFAIIRTFVKERIARKKDIDYAIGFVGTSNTPEEALRIREEARRYMESKGFHFDYSKVEKENQARRQKRERELVELKEQFLAKREETPAVPVFEHKSTIVDIEQYRERGIKVLYPRSSSKHVPPTPPKGKKRFRKRDGSTTYQLGQDISPVWGIKNSEQSDKTMQNSYKPFKEWHQELEYELAPYMEDDFPPNPEEAFKSAINEKDDIRRERHKQEIINKEYTVQDYKANLNAYDEIRKKLMSKAV